MKILQVNDFFKKVGGAELVVAATKKILEEFGHSTWLYAPQSPRSKMQRLFSIKHYLAVRKLIQEIRPDIIHAHGIYRNISPSVLLAARSLNVPIVMTLHDFHLVCPKTSLVDARHLDCETGFSYRCFLLDCYPRTRFSRIYQLLKLMKLSFHRFIIRHTVDYYFSPSNSLYNWAIRNFGIQNITLLPYLLMTEPSPSTMPPRTRNLLYIGQLVEQKGVDILLEALANVQREIPDINLKIIGTGQYEHTLKELAETLQIAGHVTFIGRATYEQLINEYRDAYSIIIPSRYVENCPIVGIEAISMGKVIIASKIGGIPDLVDDGETGFLVIPGDVDDLAKKIIYIIQNPEILPEMGARARAKYMRNFSRSAYYQTLLSTYERTINEYRNRNSQLR